MRLQHPFTPTQLIWSTYTHKNVTCQVKTWHPLYPHLPQHPFPLPPLSLLPSPLLSNQGYYKVLGKGHLPRQPVIVKAKFFSRKAERKIKEVGGACVLMAWWHCCCFIVMNVITTCKSWYKKWDSSIWCWNIELCMKCSFKKLLDNTSWLDAIV